MDGGFLKVGVLDLDGDDLVVIPALPLAPMFRRCLDDGIITMVRHTDEKIKRAAERLADDVDAADIQAQSTDDLQQVAVASDAIPADEVRLRQAVQIARGHGRF